MTSRTFGAAVLAAGLLALTAGAAPAQACARAEEEARKLTAEQAGDAIWCLVGDERRAAGRRAWAADAGLALAARHHARDMVERRYFGHGSPGGGDVGDRVRRTGGTWQRLGEVLVWGSGRLGTPRALVAAWMRSPGHRRILLDRGFDLAGVGVVRGSPRRGARGAVTAVLVAGR